MSLHDELAKPVKETEIGELLAALNGFPAFAMIVRRLAFQRSQPGSWLHPDPTHNPAIELGIPVNSPDPLVYIPSGDTGILQSDLDDVAAIFALAGRQPFLSLTAARAKRLIEALRDSAMEAECGHELGGYRVTLLARHGLTDSSDPAFGPVKYPDQGKPPGDVEPF